MPKSFRPRLVYDKNKAPELVSAWRNIISYIKSIGVMNYAASLQAVTQDKQDFDSIAYKELSQNKSEIEANSYEKKTVDDLLNYHGIERNEDLYEYLPEARMWHAPVQGGKQMMHYLKVRILPKRETKLNKELALKKAFALLTENLHKYESVFQSKQKKSSKANKLFVPFITDHHVGKLCFDAKGNITYDIAIAIRRFDTAIDHMLSKIEPSQIKTIWFPVGNDLLNTDNFFNTTTRQTQQLSSTEWEYLILQVEGLLIRAINRLKQVAPVKVILVRGNHDEHSSFSVVRACFYRFKDDSDVTFEGHDTHQHRSYTKFGNNIFCWRHGHLERKMQPKDYSTLFMRESGYKITKKSRLFVLEGHLHGFTQKGDVIKVSKNETVNGVQIIRGGALCEPDRYHEGKGYLEQLIQTQALTLNMQGLESIDFFSI